MADPATDQLESNGDSADSNRHGIFGWFLWPSMILLVYILSTGPADKLVNANIIPRSAALTFYSPLFTLSNACPPVGRLLSWYVGLWGPPRSSHRVTRLPAS